MRGENPCADSRAAWQSLPEGVLEMAIILEQGRCTQELQSSEERVAEDMDERDEPPAKPDLRDDDTHLRQRCEGEAQT